MRYNAKDGKTSYINYCRPQYSWFYPNGLRGILSHLSFQQQPTTMGGPAVLRLLPVFDAYLARTSYSSSTSRCFRG